MIPAKIDPISATTIREKGVDSIVDWFEQHKQSFYLLGWCYLSNQQQMEELFYRSILKVEKEWPRFKGKTPFEMWVTSIVIYNCRELSSDRSLQASEESEPRQDLFKALEQLTELEKVSMVLTYVQGFTKEEAVYLLQVSADKIKEHLFSGIQSLRNEMRSESTFNGCKEYQKDYIDYLERAMERSKKIDFEIHLYHCQDCQEDLAAFQDVMLTMLNLTDRMEDLHVPSSFMENVKERLAQREKQRQQKNKKRQRVGVAFASILALLIGLGFFSGAFAHAYFAWTEEDPELVSFLQQDLGQRLSLEAESDGVKIKIKSAIADDVQTLIFYEIEDTGENNQYVMNYDDGIFVENEYEIMSHETNAKYYPPDLKSDMNKKEKNVFHGKVSLLPLKTDNGTIELKINKLQKLIRNPSVRNSLTDYEDIEYKTGEWSFEIPVSKQPSIEYALDEVTEIEGIPVRFDKVTFAPTATILQFGINNQQGKNQIGNLNFNNLEVNNKVLKPDMYGSNFYFGSQHDMNWTTFQIQFDPSFRKKPKEVNVQFESANLTVEDRKTIELDGIQEYPQTFEYAGSTLSIDRQEVGQSTKFVISNHETENRVYEFLHFNIVDEDEMALDSMEMDFEGVIVDKNGIKYDNKTPFAYEELEQPRYFQTVQSIGFQGIDDNSIKLEVYGYNTTKYLDDVVKISLE